MTDKTIVRFIIDNYPPPAYFVPILRGQIIIQGGEETDEKDFRAVLGCHAQLDGLRGWRRGFFFVVFRLYGRDRGFRRFRGWFHGWVGGLDFGDDCPFRSDWGFGHGG